MSCESKERIRDTSAVCCSSNGVTISECIGRSTALQCVRVCVCGVCGEENLKNKESKREVKHKHTTHSRAKRE